MKIEEDKIIDFIKKQKDESVWKIYGASKSELKERKLVRTMNITGERGEQLAINFYCNTPNLPKLQAAPESTQNIDAISINGERYSIKTITLPHKTTGVFYGLNPKGSLDKDKQKFEYLIIVILDKNLNPLKILEMDWEKFCIFKKWHSRMNAWNISLTKEVEKNCKIIFNNE